MLERGYAATYTFIEDQDNQKTFGKKTIQRGRCYKVTIRWKNCALEGKVHHTIVVTESGRIIDPSPDPRARHESLEEYDSSISAIHAIAEVFKVPK